VELPGNQTVQSAVGDTKLFTFRLHLSNKAPTHTYQPFAFTWNVTVWQPALHTRLWDKVGLFPKTSIRRLINLHSACPLLWNDTELTLEVIQRWM